MDEKFNIIEEINFIEDISLLTITRFKINLINSNFSINY